MDAKMVDLILSKIDSVENAIAKESKSNDKKFEKLFDRQDQLFKRQDDMNQTLTKNTIVVEEHHIRSTRLENIVESMTTALNTLTNKISLMDKDAETIKDELIPINEHVTKVNNILFFWKNSPQVIKAISSLFLLFTSGYGAYKILFEIIAKFK